MTHWTVWAVVGLLVLAAIGIGIYFAARGSDSDTAGQDTLAAEDVVVSTTIGSADSTEAPTTAKTASTPSTAGKQTATSQTATTVKLVGQLQSQLQFELVETTKRYEETDFHLKWSGNWLADTSPNASGGGFRVTMGLDPSVLVRFNGTRISLVALKCATSGVAKLTLDGLVYFVDIYSANPVWQAAWSSPTLTSGIHELKVEWTGTTNAAAQGTYIYVDAFDVAGTLLSP